MDTVIPILLGISNVYLIRGKDGFILVDAGNANKLRTFQEHLQKHGILPSDIKLAVVTHVHHDHVGTLKEIKELCHCLVLVHEEEKDLLKNGEVVIPKGTTVFGKTLSFLAKTFNPYHFDSVEPAITVSETFSLQEFGVGGMVMPTPGHSKGSLSVVLETGEAFVGDLVINYLPFGLGPIFPPFADDSEQLLLSWQKLINTGVKKISPGHGKSFDVKYLIDKYESLSKKYNFTPFDR